MSLKSLPPLHLTLNHSLTLRVWTGLIHGMAILAALMVVLPLWLKSAILLAVITSGVYYRNILERFAPCTLVVESEGGVKLREANGRSLSGHILGDSLSTPLLVILHLRFDKAVKTLLINRDATDPESFRRLRVTLTCLPQHRGPPPPPF
ncbi:MAG: protein YgfX [Methylococcaceae bacterium]